LASNLQLFHPKATLYLFYVILNVGPVIVAPYALTGAFLQNVGSYAMVVIVTFEQIQLLVLPSLNNEPKGATP